MEEEVVGEFTGKLLDSVDGNLGGIVEVVDDDGLETAEKQLEDSVAADVTGTAGNQYSFRNHYRTSYR